MIKNYFLKILKQLLSWLKDNKKEKPVVIGNIAVPSLTTEQRDKIANTPDGSIIYNNEYYKLKPGTFISISPGEWRPIDFDGSAPKEEKLLNNLSNQMLTVKEVMSVLNISKRRVYELIIDGNPKLPAKKVGKIYLIRKTNLIIFYLFRKELKKIYNQRLEFKELLDQTYSKHNKIISTQEIKEFRLKSTKEEKELRSTYESLLASRGL